MGQRPRLRGGGASSRDDEFERDTGAFFKSMMGTLNHLLVADRIWMKRFTGEGDAPTTLDAILFTRFRQAARRARGEDERIVKWIGSLGEKALPAGSPT